jgi:AbiV family abortive infection protein
MADEKEAQDPKLKALMGEIARGAEITFKNAEELYSEASLLAKHRALSRSLLLHQISLEELGKIELLSGWGTGLLMGEKVDITKLTRALANHKTKNFANAYMLEVSDEERAARKKGDWKTSIGVFKDRQKEFHEESNVAKNASLYVDFDGERFVAPGDRITKEMVAEIAKRNREYLGLMYPKVKLLSQWNSTVDKTSEMLVGLKALAVKLKDEMPDDPEKAVGRLLEETQKAATKSDGKPNG